MVYFLPTAPTDLSEAFKNLDTNTPGSQATVELFKKALQHVDQIIHIDKDLFIMEVTEKAKDNPELQKLAIKILLEVGSSDKAQIEEKIDALPADPNLISKYEAIYNLLGRDPTVSNSFMLELCASPISVRHLEQVQESVSFFDHSAGLIEVIHNALKNIPEENFDKFLDILNQLSYWDSSRFIELVAKLTPEQGELLCTLPYIRVEELLKEDNKFFENYFNNARYATEGLKDPDNKVKIMQNLLMVMQDGHANKVFKENVGHIVRNLENFIVRNDIIFSLLRVNDNERDEVIQLSLQLAKETGNKTEDLHFLIQALNNLDKDSRQEIAKICAPLAALMSPLYFIEGIKIYQTCPKEEVSQLIDRAKLAVDQDFNLSLEVLHTLMRIPPEKVEETLSLIIACTPFKFMREDILNTVSLANNKEEIPQILKHVIRANSLDLKGDGFFTVSDLVLATRLVPAANREAAISRAANYDYSTPDRRILLFGCISSHLHDKLTDPEDGFLSFEEKVKNIPELQEEFTKNMRTIIQQADKADMQYIVNLINEMDLWQPSFAEIILKKDPSRLVHIIGKGQDEEIIRYLKTDEGLLQLAKIALSFGEEEGNFILAHFTPEELETLQYAITKFDLESIKKIARPEVFSYIKDGFLFITPKPRLTTKRGVNEPLSEEAKKEIRQMLNNTSDLSKRNWKETTLGEGMINALRPNFPTLLRNIDNTHVPEDFEIVEPGGITKLYGEELAALHLYTSQNYLLINGVLDNDLTSLEMWSQEKFKKNINDLSEEQKQDMERAIQSLDIIFDLLASAINKMPVETNPLYRGDAIPASELENWKKGKVFTTSKFFSCSVHPHVSEFFSKSGAVSYMLDKKEEYLPVLYIIDSTSAHNISRFSANKQEDERLYLPHQSFQVQEVDQTTQPGLTLIYLREVDPKEIE